MSEHSGDGIREKTIKVSENAKGLIVIRRGSIDGEVIWK